MDEITQFLDEFEQRVMRTQNLQQLNMAMAYEIALGGPGVTAGLSYRHDPMRDMRVYTLRMGSQQRTFSIAQSLLELGEEEAGEIVLRRLQRMVFDTAIEVLTP